MLIDGKFIDKKENISVFNPYNGKIIDKVPLASVQDVENAINWFIVLVIAATIIMLIWGGAKYMTAGDDTDKIEGARTTITNAVIGAIVVVITFAIVFVINTLTGAQIQIGLPF